MKNPARYLIVNAGTPELFWSSRQVVERLMSLKETLKPEHFESTVHLYLLTPDTRIKELLK